MLLSFNLNDKNVREICKYVAIDHDLVFLMMHHLSVYEMNLLFGIYSLFSYGLTDISLTDSAVRELIRQDNTTRITKRQACEIAQSLIDKLHMTDLDFKGMFDVFQVDYADPMKKQFDGMRIKLWSDNKELFNPRSGSYTYVKMKEFRALKSVQAKIMYLEIATWRSTGLATFSEDELISTLGNPNRHQLKALVERLTLRLRDCFSGLSLTTTETHTQHGKIKDRNYIFRFSRKSSFKWWDTKSYKKSKKVSD